MRVALIEHVLWVLCGDIGPDSQSKMSLKERPRIDVLHMLVKVVESESAF